VGPGNDACPTLWSVVVADERRRQDDSHQLSITQNFRTATDEQVWQPRNRRAGVPVERGFCRAEHGNSDSADVHWQECLLLHAFQTPSTLCHVYFVDLKITTAVTLNVM